MSNMFDTKRAIDHITEWIRDWFSKNGEKASAVIGISGGKDSTITAALLVKALGKDRVYGVIMPNGKMNDFHDAEAVVKLLDIRYSVVDIATAYDGLLEAIALGNTISKDTKINLPPRLRMATLYAVAQGLKHGGMVTNTCNASEDYVGYSTKFGDSAGDFSPLANYTVTEILAIGDELGLPKELVHKTPSDGLCGLSDEENLGFSYDVLDRYIRTGICENQAVKRNIDRRHKYNLHKLLPMPTCPYVKTSEEELYNLLLKKKMTATTAESCTGGMIASRIVNVPGSSAVLKQGLVTYSNEAKARYLGVRQSTLDAFGPVSEETAYEMALHGAMEAHTDICIASTGIAGPGGAEPGKPVGLVYIAVALKANVALRTKEKCVVKGLYLHGTRQEIREQATEEALRLAIRLLKEDDETQTDEIFDIVSETGAPTGETVTRTKAHADGVLHRTAHVWIVRETDNGYEILFQKRSDTKDSFPGMLDTSSAGHIPAGSPVRMSALRELREELGIWLNPADLTFAGKFRCHYNGEFHGKEFHDNEVTNVFVYMDSKQKPLNVKFLSLQKEEVSDVLWLRLDDAWQDVTTNPNTNICVVKENLQILRDFLSGQGAEK